MTYHYIIIVEEFFDQYILYTQIIKSSSWNCYSIDVIITRGLAEQVVVQPSTEHLDWY